MLSSRSHKRRIILDAPVAHVHTRNLATMTLQAEKLQDNRRCRSNRPPFVGASVLQHPRNYHTRDILFVESETLPLPTKIFVDRGPSKYFFLSLLPLSRAKHPLGRKSTSLSPGFEGTSASHLPVLCGCPAAALLWGLPRVSAIGGGEATGGQFETSRRSRCRWTDHSGSNKACLAQVIRREPFALPKEQLRLRRHQAPEREGRFEAQ